MVVTFIYFKLCFAGLLAGMSRADRVSTGVQPAAGSAPQQHQRTKMCGQWCRPVLHPNGCERYQHLNPLIAMVGNGPRLQQKGVKVVTGLKASMAGISSQSCWCPCVPGWNQVSFFFCDPGNDTCFWFDQERNTNNSCCWRMWVPVQVTFFE